LASKTRVRQHGPKSENRLSDSAGSGLAVSPLTKFLQDMDDEGESRLASVATEVAKDEFSPTRLRRELTLKLKRVRFPSPAERAWDRKTFYEFLQERHSIQRVLQRSTLQEIWRCLLIPRIIQRDRKLEEKNLSAIGYPLSFHRKLYREAEKRLRDIDGLIEKLGTTGWIEKYRDRIARQFRDNVTLVLLSRRYTGNRRDLVSTHWQERLAAKVAVYWILWVRLHRSPNVSNRFILQLSLLINAPIDITELDANEAEALRKAIESTAHEWRKLLKIRQEK
jgi:hypothetical protein